MKRRAFLGLLSASTASVVAPAISANASSRVLAAGSAGLSPAVSQSTDGVLRFIAFGDSGRADSAQYELARVMAAQHWNHFYDLALMLGDNVYPDGNPADIPEKFEKPYAELLKRGVSFHAVLGNHDIKKGREAQLSYQNFNMGGRAYYSFTKGGGLAEFFAIDSNRFDFTQRLWLEGALKESQAKWKIAFFHHPLYSSADRHGSDFELRSQLEPLLVKYGVNAAFSGHDHIYERTIPQQGVQYFTSGAGSKIRRGDLRRNTPFFAAGADERSSFMSVELTPERFSFQAIDLTGRVIDSGEVAPRVVNLGI